MRNHSASVSNHFRPKECGPRRLLPILVAVQLLAGAWAERASAYHAPDPADKVYAIRINEQDPELGRKRHNVGLLDVMVTNLGIIGNPGFIPQESAAAWRGGEYLYAASMWIGAVASDNLAYVSTGAYETELRPSLGVVDHIYSTYEGAVRGNRPGFSSRPDDDLDGKTDEDPLNGKDDDFDGKIDEDFAAISQQMFSCEYWDYTEEARSRYPAHRPLNVRIHQESYAWSTEGADEFVGFDFKIFNDGFEMLRNVYLGFFVDSDVGARGVDGYYTDDGGAYYATDTTLTDASNDFGCIDRGSGDRKVCGNQDLKLNICYMYDIPDNGVTARGGDVPGFIGGMFLGHTTDPFGIRAPSEVAIHTARFFNGSSPYPQGDPANDTDRYDLMQSGQRPTSPTTQPDDYRYIITAGPFSEMAPGDVLQLQMALVVGVGKTGMLTNAVNAQMIYNGRWRDVDGDRLGRTGFDGRETCLRALDVGEPLTWQDPCDSLNPTTRTIEETYCLPENYVDNDCDCCTPLFQTQAEATSGPGPETLVHWVGTVVPTAPGPFSLLSPADAESVLTTEPTLSWEIAQETDPGDTVRYTVYWSMDSLFGSSDSAETGSHTTYAFGPSRLLGGGTYHWKVRAVDTYGLTRWSDPSDGFIFHTPLITPIDLTLQAQSSDSGILLTWRVPTDMHALGFKVYRRTAGSEEWFCLASILPGAGTALEYVDGEAEPGLSYEYEVEVLGPSGPAGRWGPASAELRFVPLWLGLSPNPGRRAVTVSFGLPQRGTATLRLFNAVGREVAQQVMPDLRAGNHSIRWTPGDGQLRRLPSGSYWIRLDSPAGSRTARWTAIQ